MKKLILIICATLLLASCNNDENTFQAPTPNPIEGSWSLVSVSGGFSPTINFDPTWITFHFGQNLTVINNNPSQTVQSDGLPTGSYSYLFNETNSICTQTNTYQLSISNFFSNLCVKIVDNQMIIDYNSAADGLVYTFMRANCLTNQSCTGLVHTYVDDETIIETAPVNQNISIPIHFTVNDGCGQFGYISENNVGNIKTLKIYARYVGCNCFQALVPIETTYNFTPTTTGNQIIKIEQPDGSFLNYSILIQ